MNMKLRERLYKIKLSRVARAAERMLDSDEKNFDPKRAIELSDSYHQLTTAIYDDSKLTDRDKDSWGVAFSNCYDIPFNGLALRLLASTS